MKNNSVWQEFLKKTSKKISKDIECDLLIIGGGITGLTTAYYLDNSNLNICLVERNIIGSGASGKSTAKINYLQDILSKISSDKVDLYLKSQLEAKDLLLDIITKNKIECDLEKKPSFLFSNTNSSMLEIKKIEKILKNNSIKYKIEKIPIDIKHSYSIKVEDTYTFNPVKYLNELRKLIKNVDIYENTCVNRIEKENDYYVAYVDDIKIKCKKIVCASWYPYFIKPFLFPLKTHLEKSYLACYKTERKNKCTGINLEKEVKSFQYFKDYFVYLMNSHILCNGDYSRNFIPLLKEKPLYYWSNIDIITNDYIPFIGKIDRNLYLGTGYNTWGNTNGTLSGKILSDLILDKENKYSRLFDPRRTLTFKKLGNNILNIFYSIKGYLKFLNSDKSNKVYYQKDKAYYIDSNGKKYVVKRKCPHLHCDLIFNYQELTWDCPCHGSRFDLEGNCIFGPSEYSIKVSDKEN